ncbi:MAG: asparagine synthase-related protein [Myxococcota bacterium]|nr:asparagine synthase-related protein [Myxococcota bacterium]
MSVAVRDAGDSGQTLFHRTDDVLVVAAGTVRPLEGKGTLTARALHALVVEHGEKVLSLIRGQFVLAVWHPAGSWVARDGAGTRALYVARFGNRFCFASEPKALHRLPGFPCRLRETAVAQYLSFSFVPGHRTMLEDVFEVPGGHWCSADVSREPAPVRWFEFEMSEDADLEASTRQWPTRLRSAVHGATEELLPAAAPAVFLSGGLDSSVVVAELSSLLPHPVRTYALHFGPAYQNELEYARMVAGQLGTDHQEVLVEPKGFLPRLWSAVWHMDDPIGDPITVPNFELARLAASDGFQHVFNGEGGDPCFGGPKNLTMMLHHWYGGIERPEGFLERAYLKSYRRAYTELDRLLSPPIRAAAESQDLEGMLTPYFTAERPRSFLHKLLSINIRLKGGNLILPKVERMLGAHGVTPLSPLFQDQIVKLAFAMPPRSKLDRGVEKVVLKEAYQDALPAPVIHRPKSGMRVPVHYWFQKELRRYAKKVLSPRSVRRAGVFQPERVKQLLDYRIEEGPGRYGMRLWMLLTFEIWRRQVIEGERP